MVKNIEILIAFSVEDLNKYHEISRDKTFFLIKKSGNTTFLYFASILYEKGMCNELI